MAGVAVSVTCAPLAKLALHTRSQPIPDGVLFTEPLPEMAAAKLKEVPVMNAAETLFTEFVVTMHWLVPLHAPLHPVNTDPLAAAAVSVTCALPPKLALHVGSQLIPDGALVTVPLPEMAAAKLKEAPVAKVAETFWAELIVTMHWLVPLHAPLHPVNTDPPAAVAVSVTGVPLGKFAMHVAPQLITAGALVTVPLPVTLTESVLPVEAGTELPTTTVKLNPPPQHVGIGSSLDGTCAGSPAR
jgi:hypothetical protein